MTNSQPTAIKVESAELQYVEDYTYLGQLIGFKNMDKELKRRIALAWKTFWTLKFILLDKKLNRKIKKRHSNPASSRHCCMAARPGT